MPATLSDNRHRAEPQPPQPPPAVCEPGEGEGGEGLNDNSDVHAAPSFAARSRMLQDRRSCFKT